jgi:L-ascorbate metabolism protein UlaG (beta-lactamase superfamily)
MEEEAVAPHEAVRGKLLFPVHCGAFNLPYHDWRELAERLVAAATSPSEGWANW